MRLARLCLTLAVLLPACGAADPHALTDQGARALGAGDADAARQSFETALAGLKPGDPDYARASMGRFQALARGEPERARDEFLAYSKAQAASVGEGDYGMLVSEFLRRERTSEAIDVMDAASRPFPDRRPCSRSASRWKRRRARPGTRRRCRS
jgi:Flp pilus assembly protein TadD